MASNFLSPGLIENILNNPLSYPTAEIKGSSKDSLLGISHEVGLNVLFGEVLSSNNIFWGKDFILEANELNAIFLSAPWDIIADSPGTNALQLIVSLIKEDIILHSNS